MKYDFIKKGYILTGKHAGEPAVIVKLGREGNHHSVDAVGARVMSCSRLQNVYFIHDPIKYNSEWDLALLFHHLAHSRRKIFVEGTGDVMKGLSPLIDYFIQVADYEEMSKTTMMRNEIHLILKTDEKIENMSRMAAVYLRPAENTKDNIEWVISEAHRLNLSVCVPFYFKLLELDRKEKKEMLDGEKNRSDNKVNRQDVWKRNAREGEGREGDSIREDSF